MNFYGAAMLGLVLLISNCKSFAGPLILLDQTNLNQVKTALQQNKASIDTQKAYAQLIKQADTALSLDGFSVIDKTILAPSKDAHDYLSLSRYWWPGPSKPNGIPWVRRDGVTNPDTQTDSVDRKRLGAMTKYVHILALAYFFSGEHKYAQKGTDFIKRWFLDRDTKMNPHLEFAQSVPGIDIRRRSGILDGRLIPEKVLDAVTLFSTSSWWSKQDNAEMNQWLDTYLKWLTTSELGLQGAKQTNNHGSWYYFQVAALSWYLGYEAELYKAVQNTKRHMLQQFDEKGAQHHELARSRPYFYSCFNLEALTSIAVIANKINIKLWQYQPADSRLLTAAVKYLIPAAKGDTWQHGSNEIKPTDLIKVLDKYNEYSGEPLQRDLLMHLLQRSKLEDTNKTMYYHFSLLNPEVLTE
ncbi:alginate lyase family protein [Paraglaciecola sp.]|uniref:alginate lyase family protein n=1 Tax=Paraglaciecola sp. TaxID=1920173 RepID=UPI003263F76A